MSLFPFLDIDKEFEIEQQDELPLMSEYAWDLDTWEFKTRGGKLYRVYGNEALKIKIWKVFMTVRYREVIFSWDYGHELESLIGKGYTYNYIKAESKRMVEEALEYALGDYIKGIIYYDISFSNGDLVIDVILDTIYGEVKLSV